MGSAFTIPSLENKNNVTITEPYSKRFIKDLSSKKKFHSALKIKLPKQLKFRKFSKNLLKENFDLIVIALSLPGIDFIGTVDLYQEIFRDLSFSDVGKGLIICLWFAFIGLTAEILLV